MNLSASRRFALAFLFGAASLTASNYAFAQSIPTGSGAVTTNGITGTDPVPPSCGCGPKTPTPTPKAIAR